MNKTKNIAKIIRYFILILSIMLLCLGASTTVLAEGETLKDVFESGSTDGFFVDTPGGVKVEITHEFSDWNYQQHPAWVLENEWKVLWCNEHNVQTGKAAQVSENQPLKYEKLVRSTQEEMWNSFQSHLAEHKHTEYGVNCYPKHHVSQADFHSDKDLCEELDQWLPPKYHTTFTLSNQGWKGGCPENIAQFILTQGNRYTDPRQACNPDSPWNAAGGDFSSPEKQSAIWGEGGDGGLRRIAESYFKYFYDKITIERDNDEDKYKDYLQAFKYDFQKEKKGKEIKGTMQKLQVNADGSIQTSGSTNSGDGTVEIPENHNGGMNDGDGTVEIPENHNGGMNDGDGVAEIPENHNGGMNDGDGVAEIPENHNGGMNNGDGTAEIPENALKDYVKVFDYPQSDVMVEVNQDKNDYVVGPFYIDYSVNDVTKDEYYPDGLRGTLENNYVARFSAINNIEVYNQDGKTLESLGCTYDIAYAYDNGIPAGLEGRVNKIVDVANGENGGLIKGFESNKAFYVVVHRDAGIDASLVRGIQIKVEFKYLKRVYVGIEWYSGDTRRYWYEREDGTDQGTKNEEFYHQQTIHHSSTVTHPDGTKETKSWIERKQLDHTDAVEYDYNWSTYTLHWDETVSGNAQDHLAQEIGTEAREYATKTILIKYLPDNPTPDEPTYPMPYFSMIKKDQDTDVELYGAEFEITMNAEGKNIKDEPVSYSTSQPLTRITDVYGKIVITKDELNALGFKLRGFTGKVTINYKETKAPAGYKYDPELPIFKDGATVVFTIEKGKIVDASDQHNTQIVNNRGTTTIYDDKEDIPEPWDTTLNKVDKNGNPLQAKFDVHVRFTPEGGEEVNDPNNIIHGQTDEKGVMKLSDSDFEHMSTPIKPFKDYSGTVTLEFVEVTVENSGWTISSADFGITFTFKNGQENKEKRSLVQYSENTTAEVVQSYAYSKEDLQNFVYAWKNDLQSYVDDWPTEDDRIVEFKFEKNMSDETWSRVEAWLNNYVQTHYGQSLQSIHAFTGEKMTKKESEILSEALDELANYLNADKEHVKEFTRDTTPETQDQDVYELLSYVYDWSYQLEEARHFKFEANLPDGTWDQVKAWLDEYLTKAYGMNLEELHAIKNEADDTDDNMTKEDMMKLIDALGALSEYLDSDSEDLHNFFEKVSRETCDVEYKDTIKLVMEDEQGETVIRKEQDDIDNDSGNGNGGGDWQDIELSPFEMEFAGYVFLDDIQTKETEHYADGLLSPGDQLLYGIEVRLIDDTTGGLAKLMESPNDPKPRINPTITDVNGFYYFKGADPMHKYHIEFVYNGMQYTAVTGVPGAMTQPYQQPNWDTSSKGGEVNTSGRKNYQTITPTTQAWDYVELKSINYEIADRTANYIKQYEQYPNMDEIYQAVINNHRSDPDIEGKVNYIRNSMVTAQAGYSYQRVDGQYPHESIRNGFINDITGIADSDDDRQTRFAGYTKQYIYPGQLQIHLGLVQRNRTDLQLVSDIMGTKVELKDYKEDYKLGTGNSIYTQYIYQEDYAYAFTENGDNTKVYKYIKDDAGNVIQVPVTEEERNGLAFYDKNFNAENPNEKKSIEYYITYRVNIKNTSLQSTTPLAFITYYDKDLEPIKAYKVIDGQEGDALELSVDDTFKPITNVPEGYKTVSYLTGSEALTSNSEDYIAEIQFRVKGNENESAEDVFRRLLNTNRYVENVSEIWDTHFYSEITGYYTEESYLDADSRPGNFDVAVFNERLEDYKKATYDYENNPTQELDTKLTLALDKIIEAREDDAWHVELDIADNEYRRTISGNVWEAINDEVKSALALQQQGYGNDTKEPLIFGQEIEGIDISKLNLANIKVELIEMEPDNESGETGTQRVRAVTRTAEDGSYLFKQYLPGKYTVRFTYGEENADGTVARSNVSVGDAVRQKIAEAKERGEEFTPDPTDYLLLNGQYYQSTLANPDTNADVYWYKDKNLVDEETGKLEDMEEAPKRYSDAYDDAYSRLTQMNSVIDVSPDFEDKTPNSKEPETSSSFTYQGNWEVEDGKHNDRMYAYTSTIDIRIEYIRDKVQGSKTNKWYKYGIDNIDFGITPRVSNNVELYKNLSEFTITLNEAGKYVKQKYEIVEEDGERKIREKGAPEGDASILIKPVDYDNIAYRDGYIDVEMEQLLMQYANMEMTFEFKLKNNSERDDRGTNNPDDDIVEKLTYIKEGDKIIAVKYYQEDTTKLVSYENDSTSAGENIVYHNNANTEADYQAELLKDTDGDTSIKIDDESRLGGYKRIKAFVEGEPEVVKNTANKIADYPGLQSWLATLTNEDGTKNNQSNKWQVVEKTDEEGKTPYQDADIITERAHESLPNEELTLLDKQNIVLLAVDENELLKPLAPGEESIETVVLSADLQSGLTSLTDTDYSNMVELIRLDNSAGKVVDLGGYDITGSFDKESSKRRTMTELKEGIPSEDSEELVQLTPTLSTSKSETIIIKEPTGLIGKFENNVLANLSIVFVGLIILAGGIILIRKFVIVKQKK